MEELHEIINRIRFQIRLRDGWKMAQDSLWLAVLSGLFIQLFGRLFPIDGLLLLSLVPIFIWILIVSGYTLFKPISLLSAAKQIDLVLGLHQRLSTALLMDYLKPRYPANLLTALLQDALLHARTILPKKDLPLKWRPKSLISAGISILLLVFTVIFPNPMDTILLQRTAIKNTAQQQANEIATLRQEIEKNHALSEQDREKLSTQLHELEVALRSNPGDLETALADISQIESELDQELDPNANARSANLESLAIQLEQLAGMNHQSETDSISASLDALQTLAKNATQMDLQDQQELANQLMSLSAQALATGETQLSQSISHLSQAILHGDSSAVTQALQQSKENFAQIENEQAMQSAALQIQNSLQTTRKNLAQVASSNGSLSSLSSKELPTTRGNTNNGTNSSNTPGNNPGGGGGTTAGQLPSANRLGQTGPPEGESPEMSETKLDSQVYAPWAKSSSTRNQLYIPGQEGITGETSNSEGHLVSPGSSTVSLVPYNQVYYSYLNTANQAMQSIFIPSNLEDYVRAYFTQLEP